MYYVTRDTDIEGTLSDHVEVWAALPLRHEVTLETGIVWLPFECPLPNLGLIGRLSLDEADETGVPVPPDDTHFVLWFGAA